MMGGLYVTEKNTQISVILNYKHIIFNGKDYKVTQFEAHYERGTKKIMNGPEECFHV